MERQFLERERLRIEYERRREQERILREREELRRQQEQLRYEQERRPVKRPYDMDGRYSDVCVCDTDACCVYLLDTALLTGRSSWFLWFLFRKDDWPDKRMAMDDRYGRSDFGRYQDFDHRERGRYQDDMMMDRRDNTRNMGADRDGQVRTLHPPPRYYSVRKRNTMSYKNHKYLLLAPPSLLNSAC